MGETWRRLAAEAFGTFCLVFAGTGAIVVDQATGGTLTHPGIALTFGLVVLAMIYAIGDVSGCHINPAVTVGLWAARRFDGRLVVPYVASQCAGGLLASLVVRLLFPQSDTLGATLPGGGLWQAFGMEFLLTLILMVVILGLAAGPTTNGPVAGIVIGAVIALEALFGGPVSGASMNPARSLAPALVAGRLDDLWLYIAAPITGALAGVVVSGAIHGRGSAGSGR